jgi:hypothetical protein
VTLIRAVTENNWFGGRLIIDSSLQHHSHILNMWKYSIIHPFLAQFAWTSK